MIRKITVAAKSKSYDVLIAPGILDSAGEYAKGLAPRAEKAAVISDDIVSALYSRRLTAVLRASGLEVHEYVLPHGEESKNGASYLNILSFLAANGLGRTDIILALGGGMVGDIAAFSAATYLRGIKYIQLPTSLLAMVDSSVGGKTAIDLPEGKNLAGVFCQPDMVLIDTLALDTLPDDILRDGLAEVLKYAVLGDEELFAHLMKNALNFDREETISRCVMMKRDHVCADEHDEGIRRMLNLGHTLGHAVEKLSDFSLSHGKSVAIGLACVARAAAKAGYCDTSGAERIVSAVERLGLPSAVDMDIEKLMPLMLSDKKRCGKLVNVIVPQRVGCCCIRAMDAAELKSFMKAGM